MLLLGIDIGTSFIKASAVDARTRECVASTRFPDTENPITSLQPGWAEQSPDMWWAHTQQAIQKLIREPGVDPSRIAAIGISYQMHGLVVIDRNQQVLRDSIIWCDSRAVEIGQEAFRALGEAHCNSCLLNSPGNFTASKLAWVKQNEPDVFEKIYRIMLPGDFIAMKLTGEVTTSPSALSEGIFYDFSKEGLSEPLMDYFGFDSGQIPVVQEVFSVHGKLQSSVAGDLSLPPGIPVSYKAGDQPNNALSLNVLEPGEVAATAGTSGVIYTVTDQLVTDPLSRVNTFAHVNHGPGHRRLGVLLCINGTGIMNSWIKRVSGDPLDYDAMNRLALAAPTGSEGLKVIPFGNGAERMLENRRIGAHLHGIDLNLHVKAHLFRATQEGIAFAFRYGLDIMRENQIDPKVIRAGMANLFLSEVFTQSFVNATGVPVELYSNDGSVGAALGAGVGAGIYQDLKEALGGMKPLKMVHPTDTVLYQELYGEWKLVLDSFLG
ncbi:MAG: carbohydrate kinase [Bacteroidota bacterium]|nr:carbohydrate kinase [Bacteroidota bacterium]